MSSSERIIIRVCVVAAGVVATALWHWLPDFRVGQVVIVLALLGCTWAAIETMISCKDETIQAIAHCQEETIQAVSRCRDGLLERAVLVDRETVADWDERNVVGMDEHRRHR